MKKHLPFYLAWTPKTFLFCFVGKVDEETPSSSSSSEDNVSEQIHPNFTDMLKMKNKGKEDTSSGSNCNGPSCAISPPK